VLALMPTVAIALTYVISTGVARGDTGWWIAIMATAAVTSLQIGYFAGLCLRHILAAAPSSSSTATPFARRTAR
jgi:hypothetical protein